MENSFLKDAINRIVELATPFTLETRNGHQFCSANLHEVRPEIPSPVRYSVDTLEALVKLIRTEGVAQASLLYVRVDSARRVVVDSTYTGRDYAQYSRLPLYEAVSDVPDITVNQSMSQEKAFKSLGYISEDGMTNANSPESDSIKAWGGDTVHTYQTEKPDTFQFQLIEALNAEVLKAVYRDDNVTGDLETGLTVKANAKEQQDACWVVETILNGDTVKRVVVPCAKITEIEDIVYKDDEALGYGVTISATPDSAGNTHYEYLKKGSA